MKLVIGVPNPFFEFGPCSVGHLRGENQSKSDPCGKVPDLIGVPLISDRCLRSFDVKADPLGQHRDLKLIKSTVQNDTGAK